jgi:hypothetical protein
MKAKTFFDRFLEKASRRNSRRRMRRSVQVRRLFSSELLEERRVLAAVTNSGDDGPGSLRDAINYANNQPGLDAIEFQIPTSDSGYDARSGTFTIQLSSPLPTITDPLILDGSTQAGYGGTPVIRLDGSGAGAGASGLVITAGDSTVRGLSIGGFSDHGIQLTGLGMNVIEGNDIGSLAANGQFGISITGGSAGNRIGTNGDGQNDEAERNVIIRNGLGGIEISGLGTDDNIVAGNFIGTDPAGTTGLGNGRAVGTWPAAGVMIHTDASGNLIGTNGDGVGDAEERNVISGNVAMGVFLGFGTNTASNVIAGNYIGTDPAGESAIPNGANGVLVFDGAHQTRIGTDGSNDGFNAAERNVISGNVLSGIQINTHDNWVAGNYIGTNSAGDTDLGNHHRRVCARFGKWHNKARQRHHVRRQRE